MTLTAIATLAYKGQTVDVRHEWPAPREEGQDSRDTLDEALRSLEFYWTEGNHCCDCNRSRLARAAGADWPEMDCSGEAIELVGLRWEAKLA